MDSWQPHHINLLPNLSFEAAQSHRRLPLACISTPIGLLIIALTAAACSKQQPAAAPPPTATPASSPAENPALVEAERKYLQALESRSSAEKRELLTAAAAAHLPEAKAELAVMAKDAGEREMLAIEALRDGLATRAENGKASAQRGLARLYEAGLGLPKDPAKAKDLFRQATDQGLPAARTRQPADATKEDPWENSLGMKFVPVPGTGVLFSIWDTRVQDYTAFVEETQRKWWTPEFKQGGTEPAVEVFWEDAYAFCDWLTAKEHAAGVLSPGRNYRLPSDREWSKAVGLPGTGQYRWIENKDSKEIIELPKYYTPEDEEDVKKGLFPWGKRWPPPQGAGNYGEDLHVDDFKYTSEVGSFAPNPFGLYDMGGNVGQWCENEAAMSWSEGLDHVQRGASYYDSDPRAMLSTSRTGGSGRSDRVGFRVVIAGSEVKDN